MPRVVSFDEEFAKKVICIAEKASPVRVKAFHLLVCPPKAGKKASAEGIVSSAIQVAQHYCEKKTVMHVVDSPQALLAELMKFGIQEGGLPGTLGGSWKYGEFAKWQRQRNRLELGIETSFEGRVLACRDASDIHGQQSRKMSEPERKERKRKLNVIHSRQKRERRRAEMTGFQEECERQKMENTRLKQVNKRLEDLLDRANACVAAIESGSSTDLQIPEADRVASALDQDRETTQPVSALLAQLSPPVQTSNLGGAGILNQVVMAREVLRANMVRPQQQNAVSLQSSGLGGSEVLPPTQSIQTSSALASLVGFSQLSRTGAQIQQLASNVLESVQGGRRQQNRNNQWFSS